MTPSATYVEKFYHALSYERIDFTTAILWTFGALLAILVLFIVAKVIKKLTEARVRHIQYFGIDLFSVDNMRKHGLITEEEYRNIKASLSRQLLEQTKPETEKPKVDLKSIVSAELQKRDAERAAADNRQPDTSAAQKSLSIQDMRDAGLISEDEYRELSRFFGAEEKH